MEKTKFEHFSNELFYEIFDYLDSRFVYETFANLNLRFQTLFSQSSFLFDIDLRYISKGKFLQQCPNILVKHSEQIRSIRFFDQLQLDAFRLFDKFSFNFPRLEYLHLNGVDPDKTLKILIYCALLPKLASISIEFFEKTKLFNEIFEAILEVPQLKFCRLSILGDEREKWSMSFLNSISSIEHLVMDRLIELEDLLNFLVFMPKLRRLSCQISTSNSRILDIPSCLEQLTHMSVRLVNVSFDEFEWFLSKSSNSIRSLNVSVANEIEFLDAERWQRFLSRSLSTLFRFDFHHQLEFDENHFDLNVYHSKIERFRTKFFIDRHWLFVHQHYRVTPSKLGVIFHSKNLNNSTNFHLFDGFTCDDDQIDRCHSDKVFLHDLQMLNRCSTRFTRTSRLFIADDNGFSLDNFLHHFRYRFNPIYLHELSISSRRFRFEDLTILLNALTHLQILTIPTSILYLSIPQSVVKPTRTQNKTIQKLTLSDCCSFQDVHDVMYTFLSLKSLSIESKSEHLNMIIRYLLQQTRARTCCEFVGRDFRRWNQVVSDLPRQTITYNECLSSLCCRDASFVTFFQLRQKLCSGQWNLDYTIEYQSDNMHLWW